MYAESYWRKKWQKYSKTFPPLWGWRCVLEIIVGRCQCEENWWHVADTQSCQVFYKLLSRYLNSQRICVQTSTTWHNHENISLSWIETLPRCEAWLKIMVIRVVRNRLFLGFCFELATLMHLIAGKDSQGVGELSPPPEFEDEHCAFFLKSARVFAYS